MHFYKYDGQFRGAASLHSDAGRTNASWDVWILRRCVCDRNPLYLLLHKGNKRGADRIEDHKGNERGADRIGDHKGNNMGANRIEDHKGNNIGANRIEDRSPL